MQEKSYGVIARTSASGDAEVHIEEVRNRGYSLINDVLSTEELVVWRNRIDQAREPGGRNVRFKTTFPSFFGLLLNRYTMYPLHLLQKLLGTPGRSLVLYFEAKPATR